MERRRLARGPLAAIVIASVVLACVTSALVLRASYAGREEPFARACRAAPAGASIADAERAFARIGEPVRGRSYGATFPGVARPQSHAFFRRTGLSRWQQCTLYVDEATLRIVSIELDAGTDFTSCADRRSYPHRFWLCAIGDWLAP